MHVLVDGGGSGFGATVFLRSKDKDGFKMMRMFACSRVIGTNSSLSVPRSEFCSILLGIQKATALANDLEIPKDNIFCHTDSLINMFWIKKNTGDLTIYVANRVRKIQDYGIPIFYVDYFNNPSDNVSKVKNVKQYLNTDLWDYGAPYMSDPEWYVGRSIEEIREEKSPSPSLSEEIAKEVRKSPQEVYINLTQMIQTPSTQNIISFVQLQTNDLSKIKRLLLYCFKYLAKILPGKFCHPTGKFSSSNPKTSILLGEGSLQENSVSKKNSGILVQFY